VLDLGVADPSFCSLRETGKRQKLADRAQAKAKIRGVRGRHVEVEQLVHEPHPLFFVWPRWALLMARLDITGTHA